MNPSKTIELVAAEEYSGDGTCHYNCDNGADYLVEARKAGEAGSFLVCSSCSKANHIYAEENDLVDAEVSEEIK